MCLLLDWGAPQDKVSSFFFVVFLFVCCMPCVFYLIGVLLKVQCLPFSFLFFLCLLYAMCLLLDWGAPQDKLSSFCCVHYVSSSCLR